MALAVTLSRRRTYYGWYIVGAAFLANFVSLGVNSYGLAVFIKPMTEDLGWSRGFFSLAASFGGLLSAPLALLIGPLIDRRGARAFMLAGGFVVGAGTIGLGFVHSEWQFVLLRTVLSPLAMAGMGPMATQVAVSNWFVKKRGRALGITMAGMPAGGMVTIPLATYLIGAVGWREAWMIIGVIAWALVLVPTALFIKRRPEDLGLRPDGEAPGAQAGPARPVPNSELTWTRREAMRTPALWLFGFGFPIGFLVVTALTQHLIAYLTDIRLSAGTAALMMTLVSFCSMIAKPIAGFIAERVPAKYVLASMYALLGAGIGLMLLVGDNRAALYFIVTFVGLAWGGINVMQALLWANYYGRMSLGRVQSLAMPMMAMFSPLGTTLAGFMWDATGSYRGIFTAYIGTEALALVLIMLARPPKKPAAAPAKAQVELNQT